jgi:putative transposase
VTGQTIVTVAARRAMIPVQAVPPGPVWTDDFRHDRCRNGTPLKVLTVMEVCAREGLAIEVATASPSARVPAVLERLVPRHGTPPFIRRDHGLEFIVLAVSGWLAPHQLLTRDSDHGGP